MRVKQALLLLLCIMITAASGCVDPALQERSDAMLLPPIKAAPEIPLGDYRGTEIVDSLIYLPNREFSRLAAQFEQIEVPSGASLIQPLVERTLLRISPFFTSLADQSLSLSESVEPAVEICDNVVIINLGVTYRILTPRQQLIVRMALTQTLTELSEISAVGILVNGQDNGISVASPIPNGLATRYSGTDIDAAWSQIQSQPEAEYSYIKTVALYFPDRETGLLLPEDRQIALVSPPRDDIEYNDTYARMLVSIVLEELALGSMVRPSIAHSLLPEKSLNYESVEPKITSPAGAERLIELSFRPEIDDFLYQNGGDRYTLLTSLTYTLTGAVPGIDGVIVNIGGTPVTSIERGKSQFRFTNGWMSRSSFPNVVGSLCLVYYPTEDGQSLIGTTRSSLTGSFDNPRVLTSLTFNTPETLISDYIIDVDESGAVYRGLIPKELGFDADSDDIVSIALDKGTAFVNISDRLAEACLTMDAVQTRCFIYSIVNTLTSLRGINRVRFFRNYESVEFFNPPFSSLGEFLRHSGFIKNYGMLPVKLG
ncbi:MAG: GerMN domain-containing protein [Oscillospiraceae bacterium]|jgi:spore germination protein GerM|nr:GerMN domain-containing protein [Oscillospiraceae bacterium]